MLLNKECILTKHLLLRRSNRHRNRKHYNEGRRERPARMSSWKSPKYQPYSRNRSIVKYIRTISSRRSLLSHGICSPRNNHPRRSNSSYPHCIRLKRLRRLPLSPLIRDSKIHNQAILVSSLIAIHLTINNITRVNNTGSLIQTRLLNTS